MAAKKPATKKPVKKTAVSLEALQEVAIDFNSFMFDEDKGLKFEHLEYDDLLAELTEAAEDLVAEDVVSAETAATLKTLGIDCPAGVAEAEEVDEDDTDTDDEPDTEYGEGDEEEVNTDEQEAEDNSEAITLAEVTIPKVKKSKKLDELKALAKENGLVIPPPFLKDIAKMKEYLVKKLTAISDGEIPAKKAKAAAPKKEKKVVSGYSRSDAFADAIMKKSAKNEESLVALTNDFYVKNGGKENIKESQWICKIGLKILTKMNIISSAAGKFTYSENL